MESKKYGGICVESYICKKRKNNTRVFFPVYVSDDDVSVISRIQTLRPSIFKSQMDQKRCGEKFDNHDTILFNQRLGPTIISNYLNEL